MKISHRSLACLRLTAAAPARYARALSARTRLSPGAVGTKCPSTALMSLVLCFALQLSSSTWLTGCAVDGGPRVVEVGPCEPGGAGGSKAARAAATVQLDVPTMGTLCSDHPELALAVPAMGPGELMLVEVSLLEGTSRVDVSVVSMETGRAFRSDSPLQAGETQVAAISDGGALSIRVRLAGGVPGQVLAARSFVVTVRIKPVPQRDCCAPGLGAGCSDTGTLACLCEWDNACCTTEHDATCVSEAIGLCGLRCSVAGRESDCYAASTVAGCSTTSVENCVCSIDPYCCAGAFDDNCVHLAMARCPTDAG